MIDRRLLLGGLGAMPFALASAHAQEKELLGDDGKPATTWRLPSEIALDMPGVIVVGAASPDVIVYEFFDYNCPWCKKSAPDMDKLVRSDRNLSLRFVQNSILSLGSVQAAKVVLAVRATVGDAKAYALHRALLAHRGQVTGTEALAEVARMKLDVAAIETSADTDELRLQLRRHNATSRSLGMEATPSFAVNGMGIGGWPGAGALARVVKSVRACDQIAC
jgi:protein-disulfide isomerase